MRLTALAVVAAHAAMVGCASTDPPPGGPPDDTPPVLVSVTPDTGAVNIRPDRVVFRFNEAVRERPATGATLDTRFLISPVAGGVDAKWNRTSIDVKGSDEWRPNTTYTVTMLRGIADLRGNVLDSGRTLVFSTGPTIARSVVRGIIFDWVAGRVAPNGFIEATSLPDSTVYVTATDSGGTFTLANIPPGSYSIRGAIDVNSNRAVDPRELWDTVAVTVADSARIELLTYLRDSTPPRIVRVVVPDTFTMRVALDRPLDTARVIDTSLFTLRATDSTVVPLAVVRRATAADRDAALPVPGRGAAPPAVPLPGDTTPRPILQAIVPSRPSPVTELVVTVAIALRPGSEYRLVLREARGLDGPPATTSLVFPVPARAPARPPPAAPPPP